MMTLYWDGIGIRIELLCTCKAGLITNTWFFFFFNDPAPPEISPFPPHAPLPFFTPPGVSLTLTHDGSPMHKGATICKYPDEPFPAPPLRPATPYERAEMRNWIRHIDGLIGNLIVFNWRHHLAKTASQWSDQELAEKLKNIPSRERQEAWIQAARKPYTEEECETARAKLVQLLDKMEDA